MARKVKTMGIDDEWLAQATNTVMRVDAVYRTAQTLEHRGNPLVEALPPYLQSDEPGKFFSNYPMWRADELLESRAYRVSAIRRVRTFHEALGWHHAVMKTIYRTIWGSYDHRNPLKNQARDVQNLYEAIMSGTAPGQPLFSIESSHASMIGLVGGSGMGKSTVVRRVLSFLPQVINHKAYGFRQLVWIHIQCPPNGDLNQLLLWLLRHIDNVMGTQHTAALGARLGTFAERSYEVARLLDLYKVGLLVLDEAHYVFQKTTRESYLNFITTITNGGQTPIMHVGLPSAMEAFPRNLYTGRRAADGGISELEQSMSPADWERYCRGLIRYQWTDEPATFDELALPLQQLSGRIPALASRLFELAQIRVVSSSGVRKLTPQLLFDVSKRYFKPIEECLTLMRQERHVDLKDYDAALKTVLDNMEAEIDKRTTPRARSSSGAQAKEVWTPILKSACIQLADLGESSGNLVPALVSLLKLNPQATVASLVEAYICSCVAPQASNDAASGVDAKVGEDMAATRGEQRRAGVRHGRT